MLCLKCGQDNTPEHPYCTECKSFVGYVRENRGFIPQLEQLEAGLRLGMFDSTDAAERLQRLEAALHYMIHNLDETGAGLVSLNLDEGQQATLGGFLLPVREGLEAFLDAVSQLEPTGNWPQELWESLHEAHAQIIKGNEGVTFLARTVAGMAEEAGADFSLLGQPRPDAEAPAESAEPAPAD